MHPCLGRELPPWHGEAGVGQMMLSVGPQIMVAGPREPRLCRRGWWCLQVTGWGWVGDASSVEVEKQLGAMLLQGGRREICCGGGRGHGSGVPWGDAEERLLHTESSGGGGMAAQQQSLSLNTDQLLLSVLTPTRVLAGGEGPSASGRDAAVIRFSSTPSTPLPPSPLAPVTPSLRELGQK